MTDEDVRTTKCSYPSYEVKDNGDIFCAVCGEAGIQIQYNDTIKVELKI